MLQIRYKKGFKALSKLQPTTELISDPKVLNVLYDKRVKNTHIDHKYLITPPGSSVVKYAIVIVCGKDLIPDDMKSTPRELLNKDIEEYKAARKQNPHSDPILDGKFQPSNPCQSISLSAFAGS